MDDGEVQGHLWKVSTENRRRNNKAESQNKVQQKKDNFTKKQSFCKNDIKQVVTEGKTTVHLVCHRAVQSAQEILQLILQGRRALAASLYSQGLAGGLGELGKLSASLRVPQQEGTNPGISPVLFSINSGMLDPQKGAYLSTETFNFWFRSEAEVTSLPKEKSSAR